MVLEAAYRPRNPEESLLYQVVAGELETFLASQQDNERNVPGFVEKEFRSFLDCGVLARGFLRIACINGKTATSDTELPHLNFLHLMGHHDDGREHLDT